jgi:hypothetical protein
MASSLPVEAFVQAYSSVRPTTLALIRWQSPSRGRTPEPAVDSTRDGHESRPRHGLSEGPKICDLPGRGEGAVLAEGALQGTPWLSCRVTAGCPLARVTPFGALCAGAVRLVARIRPIIEWRSGFDPSHNQTAHNIGLKSPGLLEWMEAGS